MNTTQITSTGIAVALAVVVALGLLFFGPRFFSPFAPTAQAPEATSTVQTINATTTMDTNENGAQVTEAKTITLAGGLEVTDVLVGTGKEAVSGTKVSVNYKGMLIDGTVFDASANRNQAFDFNLGAGQVIKGWDEGIVGMKEGGKRRLVIPSALAYGNQAVGNVIPANATLIFEVELLKIQ